ncbi:MAG: GNAT family N-acetyltransferase [Ilumatobacteraceae bacterium]
MGSHRTAALLPIRTPRLELRPLRAADAPAFATYRSDPAIARFQSWDAPYPLADAERLIAEQAELGGPVPGAWIQIAVCLDGELTGDVAVGLNAEGTIATIGYTVAAPFQGRGIAREAVAAMVDVLLDDVGVHRVEASLDPANVPSARLVEQLGFDFEGTAHRAVWTAGRWADDDRYALTADRRRSWSNRPRGRPAAVCLVELAPANRYAVMRLATHHSDERFVAPMAATFVDALAPEVVDGAPVVPWYRVIQADGEAAGFVMIAERTTAHAEAFLWRLLVDRRHQRRGIGDRALALLIDRLRSEGHETLLVSWMPGRGSPEPFYVARGFVPTGDTDGDEIVARLRL